MIRKWKEKNKTLEADRARLYTSILVPEDNPLATLPLVMKSVALKD